MSLDKDMRVAEENLIILLSIRVVAEAVLEVLAPKEIF
jgi:hypothetical protein